MLSRVPVAMSLLLLSVTVAACTDSPSQLVSPQAATSTHIPTSACDAATATEIDAAIIATFTKNNFRNDAAKQFGKVKTACATNNAQAVLLTVALIDYSRGKWPANISSATSLTNLWNLLQLYVTPGDYKEISADVFTDGGSRVCGSTGCTILGSPPTSGLHVPNGAVSSPHLFAFWKADCFTEDESHVDRLGPCYEFEVWPSAEFNPHVTTAVCPAETTPSSILARGLLGQLHSGQFKVTPKGNSNPFATLDCTQSTTDELASADEGFGSRLFASVGSRLAAFLTPEPLYATHPTLTGTGRALSLWGLIDPLIFFGAFTNIAIGNLPNGTADSVGTWMTATVAPGSIQVVSSLGNLTNKPVKLDAAGGNASGGEGVRLEGIVKAPIPAPAGVYAVSWRSLAASPNVDSAFISVRDFSGAIIARIQYRRGQAAQSGPLEYTSSTGTTNIGTWNIDISQKFDLVINFHDGTVKVSVNDVVQGTFGFTDTAAANLHRISFELLGRDVHTLGVDDVSITRLPDYEAVLAP